MLHPIGSHSTQLQMPGPLELHLFYITVPGARAVRQPPDSLGIHPTKREGSPVKHRDLIVMGASAGGIEAVQRVVSALPGDLEAAVLVVLHTSGRSGSLLPQILGRASMLGASHPVDGERIQRGHIYVAPPDFHMLVEDGQLRVLQGPRENLHRPAIDPLFRSAAVAAGRRVIGVVLTGMLDDGTSGLMVVKGHGGAAIVQDRKTAMFSAMPKSALEQVPDATVLPLERIAEELVQLVGEEPPETSSASMRGTREEKETQLLEREMPQIKNGERPGEPSVFACPDCGGVLWEMDEADFCGIGAGWGTRSRRTTWGRNSGTRWRRLCGRHCGRWRKALHCIIAWRSERRRGAR